MLHLVHFSVPACVRNWIPRTLAGIAHHSATFLVSMGLLSIVLLMVMASSSVVALPAQELHLAPLVNAYGRRDARSEADRRHDSSSLIPDDNNAQHAPSFHRRHRRTNNAPGIRFDMTRRPTSCAGLLQGSESSRRQHFACALARSHRRQSLLAAGKKAIPEHLRSVAQNTAGEGSSDWKFPVTAGVGEFSVPIYLGTPPQKASIIIDTGSDLTWVQSQPCISCYTQVDPIFDPSKSATYKTLACSTPLCEELLTNQCSPSASCIYSYSYGDGSLTQGYFSTESITVELPSGEKTAVAGFAFGASVYSTGSFEESREAGILGLGQGNVSFPVQLGSHFGNKFSYCLVDWLSHGTSTMYFGDAAVPAGEVMYTPIVPNAKYPSFYYIRVMGISVGASRLSIDPSVFDVDSSGDSGTILDSGTTVTYLHQAAFDKVVAAYKAQVQYPTTASGIGLSLCFDTTGVSTPTFPTMEIHLDGAHLRLPMSNTFVTLEENTTCLAVLSADGFPLTVIGNIQQQNFDIVYDLQNKRIGFAPADCASM